MSIVISVIEENKKLYIASDKRGKRRNGISDDYQKIYQLAEDLYFGMTGIYEAGVYVWNHIKEYDVSDKYRLIENINIFFASCFKMDKPERLAIMIAGRDNNGDFFVWQKNIQGETKFIKGSEKIEFAISSNDKIEIFGEYFKKKIISGLSVRDAIIRTIEHASKIDSSISKEYELFEI